MGDEARRALSRVGDTGDPEALAQELALRLRQGELSSEGLELAAYCGHAPAAALCELSAPAHLTTWVRGLDRFGQDACALAAVALSRLSETYCLERTDDGLLMEAGGVGAEAAHENLMEVSRALIDSTGIQLATTAGRIRDELAYLPYEDFSVGLAARLKSLLRWRTLEEQELSHIRREGTRRRNVGPDRFAAADQAVREAVAKLVIPYALEQ